MHSTTNDGVPSAIVALKQLVEILVLEDVRVPERGYVERIRPIRRTRNNGSLPDLCEVGSSIV
jgi:hypothetical protein